MPQTAGSCFLKYHHAVISLSKELNSTAPKTAIISKLPLKYWLWTTGHIIYQFLVTIQQLHMQPYTLYVNPTKKSR